jgi:trans-aconitate methyltransferase
MGHDVDPYHLNERRDVLAHVPLDAERILDVGCAAGRFGALLKTRMPSPVVHGVEPNPAAAAQAGEVLDRVHTGAFSEGAIRELGAGEPYDCIVFNDVLEHMEEPAEAIRLAHEALRTGGTVVASIPNIRNWATIHGIVRQGRFEYQDQGVLDRTHLRFFCRRDMELLLERASFQVIGAFGISPLDSRKWRRWLIISRIVGNDLVVDGRYKQFVVVGRRSSC